MEAKEKEAEKTRANDLSGSEWTRYSVSVWRNIRRSAEERALRHPAMFPVALVERLLACFTRNSDMRILDPFVGSGSTLVAAKNLGRGGVGLDLSPEFLELASSRLDQGNLFHRDKLFELHLYDARRLTDIVKPNSIDFCVTSPPYWNILTRKRTADYKDIRNYGDSAADLGRIEDYLEFLRQLESVWEQVHAALRPKKYMVINVMDLRQGPEFIPLHMDVIAGAKRAGFVFDDLIIWDRSSEYNNLRALGYPTVFRINKTHEYLLIFRRSE